MNSAEHCEMELLVQAEFDGELGTADVASLEAHRAHCPICQAATADLARTRDLLRAPQLYQPAPEAVRARLIAQFGAARPTSPLRRRWFGGWRQGCAGFALGAVCAAGIALMVLPNAGQGLTDQIVASHIRALQPGHLEDVVSTDQHTVKPWFDGRLDFAPPVKDLKAEGFPLKGGRLDYVGGRPVAALVYQRDKHLIDLYVWPEGTAVPALTGAATGYNVVHWNAGGMALWAVSDLEAAQLERFAREWRQAR
jgi:anti-sigma factor RsiW